MRGYRYSSARRPRRRPSVVAGLGLALAARVAEAPVESPEPVEEPTATPTPTPETVLTSGWSQVALPTPTPWLPAEPSPSPTPSPTPTRRAGVTSCVDVTWSASEMHSRFGQVLVEIEIVNNCRRDLQTTDLWFLISGLRDGGLVQQVRAHPLETIYAGHVGRVTVGLPGSLSWYDRVEVELREGATAREP